VLGWLFGGRKKPQKKPDLKRLYSHDDLAAEFFVMDVEDQLSVLRFLEVDYPDDILQAAQPCIPVQALIDWRRDQGAYMDSCRFIKELGLLMRAGRNTTIRGVFQNVFNDPADVQDLVDDLGSFFEYRREERYGTDY